ncbi:hypothetical protein ACFQAS_09155 [Halopenitus salinus]|uniref:hypothetical protein n=1 Tax=Halopenitus salinus TaxID=1198295 RepID=UPI00361FF114
MEFIDLGEYRGDEYYLCGFVVPEPVDGENYDPDADASAWGVSVARKRIDHSNQEIVRLDTAHGQDPHIDKEYLPENSIPDKKEVLTDEWPYSRMKQYLLSTWKQYADLYSYYND